MAKLVYWDIIHGLDTNDGLSIATPVRTLTRAHAVAASGDRVITGPGVYPTSVVAGAGGIAITKTIMITPQKAGTVIIDHEQVLPTIGHITLSNSCIIRGIHFRNAGVGKYSLQRNGGTPSIIDCVFYQRDGAANTGRGVIGAYLACLVETCSFYNLQVGCESGEQYSNYFKSVTTPFTGSNTKDYNAYPGNTETHGINTSTGIDPGFIDAAAEDFRLDLSETGAPEAYRNSGRFGGPIGATGAPGPWWDARWAQSRWMVPAPSAGDGMLGPWVNDADYEDPTGTAFTGEIVEDSGDFEPIVDLAGNEDALSGRLLSPVFDWGTSGAILNAFPFAGFEDPPAGAVFDTNTSYPAKAEYRQSATLFLFDDPESTDLPWVEYKRPDQLDLAERYQQFRITYQVAHDAP